GALRANVLRLKKYPYIPVRLRELMCETFADYPRRNEIESIIPFPLHPLRLKERSFNQAEIIARVIAEEFNLPLDTTSLKRIKATEKHRAGMDSDARAASLENAFKVQAPRLIQDRTILIVDDTMTTGSTANEMTRTLLGAGAKQVFVFTFARAFMLFD
ncbi:MAG TPA: phosphoribosyltransferase family protein, partial [Blastocatellia bacterium]|nr:phosphoribosyltransferase family protein [Blastocatellia bacterium]